MKVKIEIQHYTLNLLCNLYDVVVEENAIAPSEIHFTKAYKAVIDLLERLIIKLKKKLIGVKDNKRFKLNLEYNQAYFLTVFLNQNVKRIHGLAEQSLLYNLTIKLDQQL